jgi:hypothetical protein
MMSHAHFAWYDLLTTDMATATELLSCRFSEVTE